MNENYHKTFWEDGFVLLKDYLSAEEANNIIKYANELENYPEEKGKWMIYFEGDRKKSRIENILDYHPFLNQIVSGKISGLVEEIYGQKMSLFKDKMNWKAAQGKGFRAHQDQSAWNDFPPNRFVSVALFANDTALENGCLEFVRKEHQQGLYGHNIDGKGELDPEIERKLAWEFVPTSTRDILIFDSYAPHRSGDNTTDESRRIFYFTYNKTSDGDHYYDYIKRKIIEFPPDIEREEGVIYEGKRYNLANPIV